VASVEDCRRALDELGRTLAAVDAQVRARHVPDRRVACRVTDLDVTYVGQLDETGIHDVTEADGDVEADVRVTLDSDELVALAEGSDDFLHAWLRGRVQVSASVRDLLRLRSLLGL
jgi:predicted lipid carrier protein YhbT